MHARSSSLALAALFVACQSTHVVSLDADGGGALDASATPIDGGPRADASASGDGSPADAALDAPSSDALSGDAARLDGATDSAQDAGYVCTPACAANGCGPDGCGGSCGTCTGEAQCQAGLCISPTCGLTCGAGEKCGWDPRLRGGLGGFGCIPQGWTTGDCNGVGGLGSCDFDGNLRRCTPTGLLSTLCVAGCGLQVNAACNGLTACIVCLGNPRYCAGAESAPICQDGLYIACYDNAYDLTWCADTGTTCQCTAGICACK